MSEVKSGQKSKLGCLGGMVIIPAFVIAAMLPSYLIGYCYPPALGFLCGVILVIPFTIRMNRRAYGRLPIFAVWLIAISIASVTAGYFTSRVSGQTVFKHMFGLPIPASVKNLDGRKAWYDGRIWITTFQINQSDLNQILTSPNLKDFKMEQSNPNPSEYPHRWSYTMSSDARIAGQYQLVDPPAMSNPQLFELNIQHEFESGDINRLIVWWDPSTEKAYCIKVDG